MINNVSGFLTNPTTFPFTFFAMFYVGFGVMGLWWWWWWRWWWKVFQKNMTDSQGEGGDVMVWWWHGARMHADWWWCFWCEFMTGLFMALQPRIIACGNSIAAFAMAVRFLTGPAVMAAASLAVGLRGTLLHVAIVQVTLFLSFLPTLFLTQPILLHCIKAPKPFIFKKIYIYSAIGYLQIRIFIWWMIL